MNGNKFYIWQNRLIFTVNGKQYSRLIQLNIQTGQLLHESELSNQDFWFDKEKGVLVSVWGSHSKVCSTKRYQVYHMQSGKYETDEINTDQLFYNVNAYQNLQFLQNNKLYFVDNVHSYANELPHSIKFGCFDILNKEIDFLQEVSQAAGGQFAHIIHNDNKVYLRTSNNELMIFEQ